MLYKNQYNQCIYAAYSFYIVINLWGLLLLQFNIFISQQAYMYYNYLGCLFMDYIALPKCLSQK